MVDLTTKTVRRGAPSKNIRWQRIARGRAIGYRRRATTGPGYWYARAFIDGAYRTRALGEADDDAEADGDAVLTFAQASAAAAGWDAKREKRPRIGPLTVGKVVEDYLKYYREHNRGFDRVRHTFAAHIVPALGSIPVEEITTDRIRDWHEDLANQPARLRGGKGPRKLRPATTDDQKRARKVTANRALSLLKAALNRAWKDGKIPSGREEWQRVEAFKKVERSRPRILELGELERLLASCPPDFRVLVEAAVHTGARYSELAALRCRDFRRGQLPSVHFVYTKSGEEKGRDVFLGPDGEAFFESLTAGRPPAARMLTRGGGGPWNRGLQTRPMRRACVAAQIEPLGFHQLRHSYATLYLESGGSLVGLAKQLGHSTTRMVERHYSHLADKWRAEEAREHAPKLGAARDE